MDNVNCCKQKKHIFAKERRKVLYSYEAWCSFALYACEGYFEEAIWDLSLTYSFCLSGLLLRIHVNKIRPVQNRKGSPNWIGSSLCFQITVFCSIQSIKGVTPLIAQPEHFTGSIPRWAVSAPAARLPGHRLHQRWSRSRCPQKSLHTIFLVSHRKGTCLLPAAYRQRHAR